MKDITLPKDFDRRGVYYGRLVRVVAPHFVAGFVTDGTTVVLAAPILRLALQGRSEAHARQVIDRFGWRASVVDQWPLGAL